VARYIERFSPNSVTALLVGIAGLSFILKAGGGLYWMIPAVVASLIGGVINAWLFLVRVPGGPRHDLWQAARQPMMISRHAADESSPASRRQARSSSWRAGHSCGRWRPLGSCCTQLGAEPD
jgi:hypothetical protein